MEMRASKDVPIFNTFLKAVENLVTSNTNSSGIHLPSQRQLAGRYWRDQLLVPRG